MLGDSGKGWACWGVGIALDDDDDDDDDCGWPRRFVGGCECDLEEEGLESITLGRWRPRRASA